LRPIIFAKKIGKSRKKWGQWIYLKYKKGFIALLNIFLAEQKAFWRQNRKNDENWFSKQKSIDFSLSTSLKPVALAFSLSLFLSLAHAFDQTFLRRFFCPAFFSISVS
jgi:hypothetical protein